jgi:DNA-binding NarL/FixJ family response regulator
MKTRVVLADDHLIFNEALKQVLDKAGLDVVATVGDGRAAVEAVKRFAPDVVVLDVAMPGLNGVDAAREITSTNPHPHVILLSGLDDPRFVPGALRAGVQGFVLKSQGTEDLLHAIAEVLRGVLYVSPAASQAVIDACAGRAEDEERDTLTPRERQVAQLVAQGKSNKEIAQALHIAVKTAEFHRGRLMRKLHLRDVPALVRYAIREGLITP